MPHHHKLLYGLKQAAGEGAFFIIFIAIPSLAGCNIAQHWHIYVIGCWSRHNQVII